jgi:dTDP-4-amino-4,6-dideoxygalactose transaminase
MTATSVDSIPFLDLVAQHAPLEDELVEAFRSALRTAGFVGGPEVKAFEHEFAAFVATPGCVGVSNGTDALVFAYLALGLKPGDEVITAANTFIATTEAITHAGGVVRLVDADPVTATINPSLIAEAITPRTVGIVPVHLYGQPADMDPILKLARERGLWVVEDAAQAVAAKYKGKAAGSMGDLATFSFYPGKNLGACGEGGAVTGGREDLLDHIRRLREHGQSRKYYHEIEGYNGRLHAIQAAFLRIKLRHLEEWTEGRRRVAARYREGLSGVGGVTLPVEMPWARHVYHLYVIQAERRDALQAFLNERGINTGLHYPLPLHLQNAYRYLGYERGAFPVTERLAESLLSLPMFPELTDDQVDRVSGAIREFYDRPAGT